MVILIIMIEMEWRLCLIAHCSREIEGNRTKYFMLFSLSENNHVLIIVEMSFLHVFSWHFCNLKAEFRNGLELELHPLPSITVASTP